MSGRRDDSAYKYIIVGGVFVFFALVGATEEIKAAAIPIWIAAFVATGFILRGPLGAALARRIAGETESAQVPEETYAELDELRRRIYELEERVDFSERLLVTREKDGARTDAS